MTAIPSMMTAVPTAASFPSAVMASSSLPTVRSAMMETQRITTVAALRVKSSVVATGSSRRTKGVMKEGATATHRTRPVGRIVSLRDAGMGLRMISPPARKPAITGMERISHATEYVIPMTSVFRTAPRIVVRHAVGLGTNLSRMILAAPHRLRMRRRQILSTHQILSQMYSIGCGRLSWTEENSP